jgi:hypothetical protein
MNNNNEGMQNFSRKLGLLSGPLMIVLGILGLTKPGNGLKGLSIFMIIFGVVRIGLSLFLIKKTKEQNNNSTNNSALN